MNGKSLQQTTINSFKIVNDYIFTLQYSNDYGLEHLLKGKVSNVAKLFAFAIKEMKKQRNGKDAGFACSSFNAFTPDGAHILGRNFDYMDAPLIVVWTSPKNGYKSVSVDSCTFMLYGKNNIQNLTPKQKRRLLLAPYCCMDGINEKGLAIAVLEIKTKATKQQTGKTPLTTTTAIRAVLDTCATVEEAIQVFESHDMHDSIFCNYHYQITDADGNSAIIEYVNNALRVIRNNSGNRFLSLTNHFVNSDGDNSKGFGYERKNYIIGIQNQKNGILNISEAMQVLNNCHLYYKHKRGYKIITLWSAVYNSKEASMTLCAGLDYKTAYKFSAVASGNIEKISLSEEAAVATFDFPHIDKEMALIHTPLTEVE